MSLIKNYFAASTIAAFRMVQFSPDANADDGTVVQASGSDAYLLGVTELPVWAGERVDVTRSGLRSFEFGGTVAPGQPVTADADGRAIAAAPEAGKNACIIGYAEVHAVEGDIALVLIAPGVIQG